MKKYLEKLFSDGVRYNLSTIFSLLDKDKDAHFLDLGCDDGSLTSKLAQKIGTPHVYGVDVVESRLNLAKKKGIIVKKMDLNKRFTLPSDNFDVVHTNQVIEHLSDSDNFLSEIYRILKPGGYAVVSTENASSWVNIGASILGWQIFSLTNFSRLKQGIGNPFALHRHDVADLDSWNHVRIYNFYGLKEYLEVCGFRVEAIRGAGYFPLPSFLGNLDKVHCHWMTFKIRKV